MMKPIQIDGVPGTEIDESPESAQIVTTPDVNGRPRAFRVKDAILIAIKEVLEGKPVGIAANRAVGAIFAILKESYWIVPK